MSANAVRVFINSDINKNIPLKRQYKIMTEEKL